MIEKTYLGKKVKVQIDRPLHSLHPTDHYPYPINYGYIPNTQGRDGDEIENSTYFQEQYFDIEIVLL